MDYKQSDFYRFNSDSTFLVQHILKKKSNPKYILDLCAGCGVIGLELCQNLNHLITLDFVDVLSENNELITENIKLFSKNNITTNIYTSSIGEFNPSCKYDLIVCNPPYFTQGNGKESSNYNRQVSRTFMIDSPEVLILKAKSVLAKNGKFYFLIPNNEMAWSKLIDKYGLQIQETLERASIYLLSKSDTN